MIKLGTTKVTAELSAAPEPNQLTKALTAVRDKIKNAPKSEQDRLENIALNIEIDIHKYDVLYRKSNAEIASIESSQREKTKANEKHYNQLESSLGAQEQHIEDKANTNQNIKGAHQDRFDYLHKNGLPMARSAAEFHELRAKDQLLLMEKNPVIIQKAPHFIKKHFLSLGKLVAGLTTGLGIDHIINPEHYSLISAGSFTIGLLFAVLMLALTQGSTYRAKIYEFNGKKPMKHYVVLVIVTTAYMIAEGFINYSGIIDMAKEFASESVNSGMLQGAGELLEGNATANYGLLVLTLVLVGFAALFSALTGRDQALLDIEKYKLRLELAKIRSKDESLGDAKVIDEPQFLERIMRPKARQKPDQVPLSGWHRKAVKHLSQTEQKLDQNATAISHRVAAEGARIQRSIIDLGEELSKVTVGLDMGPDEPLKLVNLAE